MSSSCFFCFFIFSFSNKILNILTNYLRIFLVVLPVNYFFVSHNFNIYSRFFSESYLSYSNLISPSFVVIDFPLNNDILMTNPIDPFYKSTFKLFESIRKACIFFKFSNFYLNVYYNSANLSFQLYRMDAWFFLLIINWISSMLSTIFVFSWYY